MRYTSTMTFTMTGMELDSLQQTQPALTTSLFKTGSQKPSFLDVFSNPNPNATPSLFNSGFFDDKYHEDDLPWPTLTDPSPSKGSIEGATSKLKNLLNWPPVQNQISPWYFFQLYYTPIMTNKQVNTTL